MPPNGGPKQPLAGILPPKGSFGRQYSRQGIEKLSIKLKKNICQAIFSICPQGGGGAEMNPSHTITK